MAALLSQVQEKLQDPSVPWQKVVLAVGLGVSAFEGWIGSRQKPFLSPVSHPTIPVSLQPYLPASHSQQTYLKSQSYALAKLNYASLLSLVDMGETYLLLSGALGGLWELCGLGATGGKSGGFPWLDGKGGWTLLAGFWDLSGRAVASFGQEGEIRQSLVFVALMTVVGTVLAIPKSAYRTFVLEEKFGFNKTTTRTFVADQVKGLALSLALELPVLAGVLKIIQWVGNDGVLVLVKWLLLFILSFQLLLIPLYPYLIAPLFNTFTALPPSSPLFPTIQALSARVSFPLGRIWLMDGSRRSSHSNAFFFGLPYLTKHIVIYDTLGEKCEPEEVGAILAHELGHWKGSHVVVLLGTSLVQTGFSLFCFAGLLGHRGLLESFGLATGKGAGELTVLSLLLASSLFTPLSAVLHFVTNSVTRLLEYQADGFAVSLGKDVAVNLKTALVRIHEENLAVYGVDWVYSAYNNNHPTLVERLEALDRKLEAEDEVEAGREGKKTQ